MAIKAWWACKEINNFGDVLTPYLLSIVTGEQVIHSNEGGHFLACGSVMSEATPDSIVLGAGFMSANQKFSGDMRNVMMVRGGLTAAMLPSDKELFCIDPVMFLPKVFNPDIAVDTEVTIIPHYVDYKRVLEYFPAAAVVDMTFEIEPVIRAVMRSKHIITSSLHGIGLAAAYGKPFTWVQFGDNIAGDGMKFFDLFDGLEITPHLPINCREEIDVDFLVTCGRYAHVAPPIVSFLWEQFTECVLMNLDYCRYEAPA